MNQNQFILKLILITIILIKVTVSLKCRIHEDPSDGNMKNVIRTCIRKMGDDTDNYFNNNNHSTNSYNNNNNYNDRNQNPNRNQNNNGYNNNRNNNNYYSQADYFNQDSFDDDSNDSDEFRLKNREHFNINSGRKKRSNNNYNQAQDRENRRQSNNNNNGNNNDRNNNDRNNNNNRNNNNSQNDQQERRNQHDKACVVHCFFEEMNMLNNNDYPDKMKVLQILTKNLRDHELKEFYTDSIQECFHFLEMEKRKDKCEFSKNLINCISEYARTNCEDWQDNTMILHQQ